MITTPDEKIKADEVALADILITATQKNIMPAKLRDALSDDCNKVYLDLAEKGRKGPSAKNLRMMAAISYISSISAKEGHSVPADEDGKGAVAREKYLF